MNEFHHVVTIGSNWNWYFVVIPALVILITLFGSLKYAEVNGRIRRRNPGFDTLLKILSVIMTVVSITMIVKESFLGLVQLGLNGLSENDDPLWALILVGMGLSIFSLILYVVFLQMATIGGWIKLGYLKERKIEAKKKTEAEEKARKEQLMFEIKAAIASFETA